MLTLRSAAELLAAARSRDGQPPLAAAAGFRAAALPLDASTCHELGLDGLAQHARIIPGEGTLRALLVEIEPGAPLRDRIAALAQQLARRAPHLLWLIIASSPGAGETAIAAWRADDRGKARVAALVAGTSNILPSDAETLRSLSGAPEAADLLTHALWLDVLGRQALTRRFYRALESVVSDMARDAQGRAGDHDRREFALLNLSRLLFLVFLEAKGWLDGDPRYLEHRFDGCMAAGGRFHRRVLLPLFFGTLNTPPRSRAAAARALGRIPFLNGGLFARTPLERRAKLTFPDETLGRVFSELLLRYRFTAREDSTAWSEAAIDPEMLGKALENLMSSRERSASGAFYTPQPIVEAVTHAALLEALAAAGRGPAERALRGESLRSRERAPLLARLRDIRVLDPACGSGAFLVHALETMAALAQRLGDPRSTAEVRRELLTRAVFGVDVNPMAVWLGELRLWLSVVIESGETDPLSVPPLPNLDRNIRAGDALSGAGFRGAPMPPRGGAAIARLRDRYARATGARKRTLQRALDRAERALAAAHLDLAIARNDAARRDLIAVLRGRDLFGDRIRPGRVDAERLVDARSHGRELRAARRALLAGGALPFAWATHFPHVPPRGGFDVVIGNPPWVRLHKIPPGARAALRARFAVFRAASWERGAMAARAGAGFAAQVDLAALFLERSLDVLRPRGTLALLLPAKLWRSLAGGGARRLVAERAHVLALEDWTDSPHAFDAAVYPSLLVARARGESAVNDAATPPVAAATHRRHGTLRWEIPVERLTLDADAASPWLALPPPVREAFDRVARAGVALAASPLGPPLLGVKCGCNEAFVVSLAGGANGLAQVRSGARQGAVERSMLRPLVRGEHVTPWSADGAAEFMIWTHGRDGAPLARLPLHAAHWFSHWRHALAGRADARHGAAWWTLFRTASARADVTRVVWADIGRAPRALILPAGDPTVALNSCYVLPCSDPQDANAIAALLNSPLAAAWLGAIAEPARGGYKRFLAWTVALLPLPHDWPRARDILAPLADRAIEYDDVDAEALLAATLRAYRVRRAEIDPLLAWGSR